jgi:hypothetical protein
MPGLRQPGAGPKKQKAPGFHTPVRSIECQGGAQEVLTERLPSGYVL